MFLRSLVTPITDVRGVGPKTLPVLKRAGIDTAAALLCRYPRGWEDRSRMVPIAGFREGKVCTDATVVGRGWVGYGPMRAPKITVEDETGRAVLVGFGRQYLFDQCQPGRVFRVWGRFYYKYGAIQSTDFEFGEGGGPGKILPVYPLGGGLTQGLLRKLVTNALARYAADLEDELPAAIRKAEGLMPKAEAVRAIHFPPSMEALERAKKTLIWEELFYLEMMVGRRSIERKGCQAPRAGGGSLSPLQRRLVERLPFTLTEGQLQAIADINAEMDGPFPLARLLQGDVGSGKTLVAFLACVRAVEQGGQALIMAPTELLARQHAENAARLLEPIGIEPCFLTGNVKASGRRELLKRLASGEVPLALGTHALFSRDVEYRDLRLAVIDEQHRFGVTQRALIMAKGNPGLLMMSATPIPRTLALTVFGDLDVSVIKDLPPGRKPVKTHLARQGNEQRVYEFVRRELAAGRQAYFVYPLIGDENGDSGGEGDLKDAVTMAERLANSIFPEYRTALVHSRIDEAEKRRTMERFRTGEIRILAATSVVEVGVDVPNASCMVIEHAERFGLSALHQLRGRVGRGPDQSYCFLVYTDDEENPLTDDGRQRLKIMLEHNDGFVIAEEDLKLRGPGQIAGVEQSGYLKLGIADPVRDVKELAAARDAVFAILKDDPELLQPANRCIARVLAEAPPFAEVNL